MGDLSQTEEGWLLVLILEVAANLLLTDPYLRRNIR